MKRYLVEVPIAGVCRAEVEADGENEAVKKALEGEGVSLENVKEWNVYDHIEGSTHHKSSISFCVKEVGGI